MKSTELRAGNILYSTLTHTEFACNEEDVYNLSLPFNKYNAIHIQLSEEWLLRFGFEKSGAAHELNGVIIWWSSYSNSFSVRICMVGRGKEIDIKLKYVHQLQNLYFALTGEELTLE